MLIFIDESGEPSVNSPRHYFVLGMVIFDDDKVAKKLITK